MSANGSSLWGGRLVILCYMLQELMEVWGDIDMSESVEKMT